MAEYIGNMDMSAFVMDYDHNAIDPQELKKTHYAFYQKVRELNPNVPIIFITKSDVAISDSDTNYVRREIIKQTYNKAIEAGDKNVYFISGEMIYGDTYRDFFMVDGCHRNDAGMLKIAETIYPVLKEILTGK
jgi:lysophospholipase L1-like esterase